MNTSQWIRSLIKPGPRPAIPIMTHPGIEIIGRTVLDAVTDGEVHYNAVKALNDKFPQAAACTTIMDLTVEAEAFGCEIYFSQNEVPSVKGRLVSNAAEIEALPVPGIAAARVPQYLKAVRLATENIDKPVFAGCIGPYSLAGRLYDMTEIMMAIYTEPDAANLLLEKCTAFIFDYCRAIKQTGAAGVIMAEPAAGLLSDDDCRLYSSVYIKKIVDEVQSEDFAVILHNCGNTGQCTGAMFHTGAMGYHFGNKIDIVEVLQQAPADVLIMGNIDPVGVLKMGTPEQVEQQTAMLLDTTRGYYNYIISSGCDTPPEVPFENIEAFYRTVEDFG
ncbi:MAG: uroporphyrinogen decarboxylase family protein [Alistipes sp.]|nr:uroporphyrinogen decarboxylase family protein [Alistipes sp.]